MPEFSEPGHSLMRELSQWWQDRRSRSGFFASLASLAKECWQFLRDSTPARRRQRYGDVDYDWDQRVDTTSATISWRARFIGHFHSPYQPTDPALFHEMLQGLLINFPDFTFIDLGSGKGRVLLLAADYPFRRILGVELLSELERVAQENLRNYASSSQKCFSVESVCADARNFSFPAEPTVLYLFNPLPESGLRQVMANLDQSMREHPRPVYVLYHNPLLEPVVAQCAPLRKIGGSHQYSVFTNHPAS